MKGTGLWEVILDGTISTIRRFEVPGGWIYETTRILLVTKGNSIFDIQGEDRPHSAAMSTCFVPDPPSKKKGVKSGRK